MEKTILQNIANFILSSNRDLGKASKKKLTTEPRDFCSHSCNTSGNRCSRIGTETYGMIKTTVFHLLMKCLTYKSHIFRSIYTFWDCYLPSVAMFRWRCWSVCLMDANLIYRRCHDHGLLLWFRLLMPDHQSTPGFVTVTWLEQDEQRAARPEPVSVTETNPSLQLCKLQGERPLGSQTAAFIIPPAPPISPKGQKTETRAISIIPLWLGFI